MCKNSLKIPWIRELSIMGYWGSDENYLGASNILCWTVQIYKNETGILECFPDITIHFSFFAAKCNKNVMHKTQGQ